MERDLFDKSLDIVKKSLENVLQEMLIQLPDNTYHMVYITELRANEDGSIEYAFATPSEDRKEELSIHVENCIKGQIEERKGKVIKW